MAGEQADVLRERWGSDQVLVAAGHVAAMPLGSASERVAALLDASGVADGTHRSLGEALPPIGNLLASLRHPNGPSEPADRWLRLFEVVVPPGGLLNVGLRPGDIFVRHSTEDARFDIAAVVRGDRLLGYDDCMLQGIAPAGSRRDRFVEVEVIGAPRISRAVAVADGAGRLDRHAVVLRPRANGWVPGEPAGVRESVADRLESNVADRTESTVADRTESTVADRIESTPPRIDSAASSRIDSSASAGSEAVRLRRQEWARSVLPPVPEDIALQAIQLDEAEPFTTLLPSGCYVLSIRPGFPLLSFQGTFRVHHEAGAVSASGDLYVDFGGLNPFAAAGPDPAGGIPVFERWRYNHYLRVTGLRQLERRRLRVDYEAWVYDHAAGRWSAPTAPQHAVLERKRAPQGYRTDAPFFEGDVVGEGSGVRGTMRIGHISNRLRKMILEIDRVSASEAPVTSGSGPTWTSIMADVGWDVRVQESDASVAEPSGAFWSAAELHAELLRRRDRDDLDREWRFHLLCVRRLDMTDRGVMYDIGATDSNNVPREGAAIASHWEIPDDPIWGSTRKKRFGTAQAPYFRTAVHELSHAMGLLHPTTSSGTHIMQTTEQIAANATSARPFPSNITWRHADEDRKRLRHLPDHWVRPGGRAFDWYTNAPPMADTVIPAGLRLRVEPVLAQVPLGAPVRVELVLENDSDRPIQVPSRIGLMAGNIRGSVSSDADVVKPFRPLLLCIEQTDELVSLIPGGRLTRSETLLRGPAGALFRYPGRHEIDVRLEWKDAESPYVLTATTDVEITPAVDAGHAAAAEKILNTPDALLTLAIGGDHLHDGIEAVRTGLANPVLRPHFAYVEAKRIAQPFFDRPAELDEAARLMEDATVLSRSEAEKAEAILDLFDAKKASGTLSSDGDEHDAVSENGVRDPESASTPTRELP